jgi:ankyrin repeat protein
MKSQLIAIVVAVLLVGCGESQPPEPPTAKATDISIHKAARDGNIEAVKQHLAAGTDVNAKGNYGLTPLYWAAQSGYKEVAELLIAKGADVNAKSSEGTTPLHRATYYSDHKEIAELLISKGADVNAKDDGGKTPLDWAYGEAADLIRKHGGKTGAELKAAEPVAEASKPEPPTAKAPDISIHDAAYEGNIEAVKQHLAAGTDVNAKGGYSSTANTLTIQLADRTPLHEAASWGHKEVAELLIDNGADVNVKSGFGQTPLHWACNEGRHVAELLITKGADVNAIDAAGQTPLDWAEEEKQTETANLLRKHGGKTGKELEAEGK